MRAAALLVVCFGCREVFGLDQPVLRVDAAIDGHPTDTLDGPRDAHDDTPPSGCPSGYMALAGGTTGHKYKRLTAASDWNTQLNACAATSLNAYLAIPDDQAELDALGTFASAVIWVGIDDLASEGMYMTVKNQPATFLPWAAGEPNNGPPEEDCVSADDTTSTLLSTDRCSLVYIAICECEP